MGSVWANERVPERMHSIGYATSRSTFKGRFLKEERKSWMKLLDEGGLKYASQFLYTLLEACVWQELGTSLQYSGVRQD